MRDLRRTLGDNGVEVMLSAFYVDDVRLVTPVIPPGLRWDPAAGRLTFDQQWMEQDLELEQDHGERTSRLLLQVMNTLTPDLKFTLEVPSQFNKGRIPTLDSEWWIVREGQSQQLLYSFFCKPMSSPYCVMEATAWAWNSQCSSLSQEVIRRMSNISEMLPQEERNNVIRDFLEKLRRSGYSREQSRTILQAGLRGYEYRRRQAAEGGVPIHRGKHQTQQGRAVRKMLEKANWYKHKTRQDTNMNQQDTEGQTTQGNKFGRKRTEMMQDQEKKGTQPATVMFVPRTLGGKLLTKLREEEEGLARITKKKVRLVEEAGVKLRETLCRSDPWEGTPCLRPKCTTCSEDWGRPGSCRTRSMVYENVCVPCRADKRVTRYVGETARTLYERGKEHAADALNMGKSSH